MFLHRFAKEFLLLIGIPYAHLALDKFCIRIHDFAETFLQNQPFSIALQSLYILKIKKNHYFPFALRQFSAAIYSPSVHTSHLRRLCRGGVVFVVTALYAGTLATRWTTALACRTSTVQLAALLLLLATLTIAARCYASVIPTPNNSPILNSNKIHHSSRLVLTTNQRDTSVIVHKFYYNHPIIKRTTRELNQRSELNLIFTKTLDKQTIDEGTVFSERHATDNLLNLEKRSDEKAKSNNSEGVSVNLTASINNSTSEQQNDSSFQVTPKKQQLLSTTGRPMPPVHVHSSESSVNEWGVWLLVVSAIVLTLVLGLATCVLSHYRTGAAPPGGGTASHPHNAAPTPTSAPMLSVVSAGATAGMGGGMDRLRGELAATRDRQVRLQALHTDLSYNLPPRIALPDGEDHHYSSNRFIHLRTPDQESEIYQKCIRPPPNRTVLESESPPPYRSSSAGLLGSSSSSSSDWSGGSAPLVVRCHSMTSTSKHRPEVATSGHKTDFLQRTVKIFTGKKTTMPAPTSPVVVVPTTRSSRRDHHQNSPSSTNHRTKPGV